MLSEAAGLDLTKVIGPVTDKPPPATVTPPDKIFSPPDSIVTFFCTFTVLLNLVPLITDRYLAE
jgi:hypothetical protein